MPATVGNRASSARVMRGKVWHFPPADLGVAARRRQRAAPAQEAINRPNIDWQGEIHRGILRVSHEIFPRPRKTKV